MKVYLRKGDSLWKLSKIFKIPFMILRDSNRHLPANMLEIGEEITIPGYAKVPYTIRKGDTLWKIASENHLSAEAILLLNQLADNGHLLAGETIELPEKITRPCIQNNVYCNYKKMAAMIEDLSNLYPFITVNTIGESVLGNPIKEIRVGKGEKKVHINGSFHANEWITTLIIMRLLNTYLLSLTDSDDKSRKQVENCYQKVELSLVPMVNPDGVNLVLNGPPLMLREQIVQINKGDSEFVHWKANIRGVDLNKQYPANWEIDKIRKAPKSPAPRDFPGAAPLTEPEAIAMADLARDNQFACVLAFHTQGEEFYWGYEGYEPPESAEMAKEFAAKSGYKAIQYIDSHGGFKDWFLQEFRRPGFTIELGRGINPLPLSQFDDIFKRAEGIFFTALSL